MECIVDIQGFRRSSNIFILKEMAVIGFNENNQLQTFHFQPPCKWSRLTQEEQKVNRWLQNNFHGIPWNAGSVPYRDVIKVVQECLKDATKIYVKGLEKKKWLEEVLPGKYVVDLSDLNCPQLKKITKDALPCIHHPYRRNPICAEKNVLMLKQWMLSLQKEDDCSDYQSSQFSNLNQLERDNEILYSMYN